MQQCSGQKNYFYWLEGMFTFDFRGLILSLHLATISLSKSSRSGSMESWHHVACSYSFQEQLEPFPWLWDAKQIYCNSSPTSSFRFRLPDSTDQCAVPLVNKSFAHPEHTCCLQPLGRGPQYEMTIEDYKEQLEGLSLEKRHLRRDFFSLQFPKKELGARWGWSFLPQNK